MNRLERARRATALHEAIAGALVLALATLALGWLALLGDDIRAHRMGISAEQLDVPPEPERVTWQDRPNDSRCGWNCIGRLPQGGETWGE